MLKKELAVAVILLFIGLAFAPGITGDIEKTSDDRDTLGMLSENTKENFNCNIVGITMGTTFVHGFSPIEKLLLFLLDYCKTHDVPYELGFLTMVLHIWYYSVGNIRPLSINETIFFGYGDYQGDISSIGWVWTNGKNGKVNWEGFLQGNLGLESPVEENSPPYYDYYIGAVNFNGYKIFYGRWRFFFGRASHVSLRETDSLGF